MKILSVTLGEALASEDSIHMVPFQFDLIQLLPKCQQVELFFLTFSTGTCYSSLLVYTNSLIDIQYIWSLYCWLCAVVESEDQLHNSPCLPNELLLSLFHSSLEHELNDREIPLADTDHAAFIQHILERERNGHTAPFSLPVIKGQCFSHEVWQLIVKASKELPSDTLPTEEGMFICAGHYPIPKNPPNILNLNWQY